MNGGGRGGGGGGALNHLPLLFCKSVYYHEKSMVSSLDEKVYHEDIESFIQILLRKLILSYTGSLYGNFFILFLKACSVNQNIGKFRANAKKSKQSTIRKYF